MKFKPCNGNCTDEGAFCEGCGRTHEDVSEMKGLVSALVKYAKDKEYENIEEYADAVADRIKYKMGIGH